VGEIIFDDEIPFGDEIRIDAGRVDFIKLDFENLPVLLIFWAIARFCNKTVLLGP
jgi:hypothetical protein